MSALFIAFLLSSAQADEVEIKGYVRPALQAVYRPTAVPADQQELRMRSSLAGVIFQGSPVPHFSFKTHLRLGAEGIDAALQQHGVDALGTITGGPPGR